MSTIEEIATNQATDGVHCSERSGDSQDRESPLSVLHLRCFVRRVGSDCYLAECVDLDISAEAITLDAAVAGLEDAVCGYLHVAFDQDTNAPANVLRPSPLRHRIRYYFEYLKHWVSALFLPPSRRVSSRFFQIPTSCAFSMWNQDGTGKKIQRA
jgi:hypothetical protein